MLCNLKEIQKYISTDEYCSHQGMRCDSHLYTEEDFIKLEVVAKHVAINGFAIVQWNDKQLRTVLKALRKDFGPAMKDSGIYKKYIAKVQAINNGRFYINSHISQPLHTDEGYKNIFPRYTSLYCMRPSSQGGTSTIVQVQALFAALQNKFKEKVWKLFQQNAIDIQTVAGSDKKRIFFELEKDRVGISYSPVLIKWRSTKLITEMITFVNQFIHNPENQYRISLEKDQLLIMDNCRVLHGRTGFSLQENRLFLRFWNQCISI